MSHWGAPPAPTYALMGCAAGPVSYWSLSREGTKKFRALRKDYVMRTFQDRDNAGPHQGSEKAELARVGLTTLAAFSHLGPSSHFPGNSRTSSPS